MIDCSKCVHDEVCANKVVNDGLEGECGCFQEWKPQGEWIYHDKLNMFYCKDCGLLEPFTKEEIEEGCKLPNFCQQCGADMRQGGDNT